MLYKEYIKISKLSIHKIGNKLCLEGVEFSNQELVVDSEMSEILKTYFLLPFKKKRHSILLIFLMWLLMKFIIILLLYLMILRLFMKIVRNLQVLYEQSSHPNIKRGELYVAYFKDCIVDGKQSMQ